MCCLFVSQHVHSSPWGSYHACHAGELLQGRSSSALACAYTQFCWLCAHEVWVQGDFGWLALGAAHAAVRAEPCDLHPAERLETAALAQAGVLAHESG